MRVIQESGALLLTKLSAPDLSDPMIERPELLERLDVCLKRRVTLVSAPAGAGKTTILTRWSQGCGLPVAWITLDHGDNHRVVFLRYLAAAAVRLGLGLDIQELARLNGEDRWEEVLSAVINAATQEGREAALILDDYQLITDGSVHACVSFLVEHLPPGLHIILSTRVDPDLPLERWRARGYLLELRANDLFFSPEAAAELVTLRLGSEISKKIAKGLHTWSEGWPALLHLITLAGVQTEGDWDASSLLLAGRRWSFDFLRTEIFTLMSEEVQRFALRTAILDRPDADLCAAVTGAQDADDYFSRLERAGLLAIDVRSKGATARWLTPWREFLLDELGRSSSDEEAADLHRRAMEVFIRRKEISQATAHALRAGQTQAAVDIAQQGCQWSLSSGDPRDAADILRELPSELILSSGRLCLSSAWVALMSGRFKDADEHLAAAERSLTRGGSGEEGRFAGKSNRNGQPEPSSLRTELNLAKAFLACMRGDALAARPHLDAVEASILRDGNLVALYKLASGMVERVYGELSQAQNLLAEAEQAGSASGNRFFVLTALYELARLDAERGKIHSAAMRCHRAFNMTSGRPGIRQYFGASSLLEIARLHYEWNELDAAERALQRGYSLAKGSGNRNLSAAFEIWTAKIAYARGQVDKSIQWLTSANRSLKNRSATPDLRGTMALQAALWLQLGDLPAAVRWAHAADLYASQMIDPSRETEYLVLARIWLAQAQAEKAGSVLERLAERAEGSGRWGSLISILAYKALAYMASGQTQSAVAVLQRALLLAEPEGYMRTFLDLGAEMARLLSFVWEEIRRESNSETRIVLEDYVRTLLAAMNTHPAEPFKNTEAEPSPTQALVEPLSNREVDVLVLIAAGMSNQQIAERLVVSIGTVKWHIINIYRKMNVHSRAQALAHANRMGLLLRSDRSEPRPGEFEKYLGQDTGWNDLLRDMRSLGDKDIFQSTRLH